MELESIKELADLLRGDKVLGEPTRLLIMILLFLNIKMKFTELQKILGLTPGNLSSHLKKLQEAEYIKIRKTFILELRPTTIIEITQNGAKKLREFMNRLETVLRLLQKEY